MTDPKLDALREASKKATSGHWRTGREDMQSYDGQTGKPFRSIYCDDERAEMHLGQRLPFVVVRLFGEDEKDLNVDMANAAFIVACVNYVRAALAASEPVMSTEGIQNKSASNQSAEPASTPAPILDVCKPLLDAANQVVREIEDRGSPANDSLQRLRAAVNFQPFPPQSVEAIAELREVPERWRSRAIRYALAGPTANKETVDALRFCADALEAALERMKGDSQP